MPLAVEEGLRGGERSRLGLARRVAQEGKPAVETRSQAARRREFAVLAPGCVSR